MAKLGNPTHRGFQLGKSVPNWLQPGVDALRAARQGCWMLWELWWVDENGALTSKHGALISFHHPEAGHRKPIQSISIN